MPIAYAKIEPAPEPLPVDSGYLHLFDDGSGIGTDNIPLAQKVQKTVFPIKKSCSFEQDFYFYG